MSKVKPSLEKSREKLGCVVRQHSNTTLKEVIKHVKANNGDLDSVYFEITDPDGYVHGPTISFFFTSPETDEEWQRRLKEMDKDEAREKARKVKEAADKKLAKKMKEERERAEYERLKAKFG